MKTQVTLMGKSVEVELDNVIASILTTKGNLKLDASMKATVIDEVTKTNEFNVTEISVLSSMLNSDNFESFSQFKTMKAEDAYESALELIGKNGETSAMEVRNDLRAKGFWAKYFRVKELLERDADTYNLKSDFSNGQYRKWVLKDPNATPSTIVATPVPSTVATTPATPKKPDWGSTKIGDWKVYQAGTTMIETVKNSTRNAAKWVFAKKYNLDYTEIRANIEKD